MSYDIELEGTLHGAIRRRLRDLVGDDAVGERGGHTVVSAPDQAAMIGIMHRLNDLGLDIDRISRS